MALLMSVECNRTFIFYPMIFMVYAGPLRDTTAAPYLFR